MKILVNESSGDILTKHDCIGQFINLRKKYSAQEVFILESLSGPDRDCTQSVIGFSPVFSLNITNGIAVFDDIRSQKISEAIGILAGEEISSCYSFKVESSEELFSLLREIEQLFESKSKATSIEGLGWFGYFGYDTIFMIEDIERRLKRDDNVPIVSLSVYLGVIRNDLSSKKCRLTINEIDDIRNPTIDEIKNLIDADVDMPINSDLIQYHVKTTIEKNEYINWFNKAKHHISMGDIYQIQLGHELRIKSSLDPLQVYMRMRINNPSPYMYLFTTSKNLTLIGASPEMFTNTDNNGVITMRPIAGTVRKPLDKAKQQIAENKLQNDVKEKAEHLMLVDLCRNDIARCCLPKSLNVDELMITEAYSHVIHLVSNISGRLAESVDKFDAISATFPAGTMTGTPKIRAVELIEETEKTPRGIYAGALGYFGFNNVMISALCIRTAIWQEGIYSIRASGGIVEDSTAEGEWNETISKLSATYLAITGKELINESFIN